MKKPIALIILDGWGIREMDEGNAVTQAHTPNYDSWLRQRERSILRASGPAVGLPAGQMGNSEVGHLNLGAGRIVYQDITRIDLAIENGELATNGALVAAMDYVKKSGGRLHLLGLVSPGGVHSHTRHLFALLAVLAAQSLAPVVHVITDGRDTPPRSGLAAVEELAARLADGGGQIATVSGRYYAMDRDKRWPRIQRAFDAMTRAQGAAFASAAAAIEAAYAADVTDEFIEPAVIDGGCPPAAGDALLFYNFRADRMRQIVGAFSLPDFAGFSRDLPDPLPIFTMTNYEEHLPVQVLFPDVTITNPLAEVLSKAGRRQFHAAETEKYAHVTYFFNGGGETPFAGEERLLVPSPKVATYDLQPEMSAPELAAKVIARVQEQDDDFILVNFANPDMVGHTGDLNAAVKAVTTVDECAGRLVQAVLDKGGVALVTADHGNAERMVELSTGQPHTYHTTNPVSFFVLGPGYYLLRPSGILADVAPTVLHLLGIEPPEEMTGQSLIEAVT